MKLILPLVLIAAIIVPLLLLKGEELDETPADDLFRLQEAVDEAYDALNWEGDKPTLRITGRRTNNLASNEVARAVLAESGEYIYMRRSLVMSDRDLTPILIHELAHIQAWREYGPTIQPHGWEYLAVCTRAGRSAACDPTD